MRDLGTALRLAELRASGAAALKIEGRLKTPEWVRRAVSLYRRALDGADPESLAAESASLGEYTGRELTSAYLDGEREGLTGLASGRRGSGEDVPEPGFELHIVSEGSKLRFRCEKDGRSVEWDLPVSAGAKARRSVPLRDVLERLEARGLSRWTCPVPDIQLAPRMVNALESRVAAALHAMRRRETDPQVRVALSAAAQAALAKPAPCPENRLSLGMAPDRVRIEAERLDAFPAAVEAVVEGVRDPAPLKGRRVVVALPAVFFEEDIPEMRALLAGCASSGLRVEVNSWGGWRLAREAKVRMEAGPGLSVLNSLAAKALAELGMECVTLSAEADRAALEEATACCPVPCALAVFGRPPLLVTRARLDAGSLGRTFQDRRGVRMRPALERGLWTFRPEAPFDWRGLSNARIRVRHLVMDLVGSPDPASEWSAAPSREGFRFNYGRELV
jgi:putative protease